MFDKHGRRIRAFATAIVSLVALLGLQSPAFALLGTTTVVTSSNLNSTVGGSVTFTATVSSLTNPSGTVTFKDGATTLGTTTIDVFAGQATFTTSALTVGSHTITATYNGNLTYDPSTSNPITQTVSAYSSSTAISLSSPSITVGNSVTVTATVTSGGGTPTGNVTFKAGASTIGTGTLNGSGVATLTTSALAVGSYTITAVYDGSTNFATSTSSGASLTVSLNSCTTGLVSSQPSIAIGEQVNLTATITYGGAVPTGTVTFRNNGVTIGSSAVNGSGQATLSPNLIALGTAVLTATYNGNSSYATCVSPTVNVSVSKGASVSAVSSSANPSSLAQSVTFTATVAALLYTPTGTVTFKNGATTLGTGTLNGAGQANLTTSALPVGTHSITVEYGGDANLGTSTSLPLSQIVIQGNSTVAVVSSINPSAFSASVTFTATVTGSGATPTGTVTFLDGLVTLGTGTLNGSGQATFATSALSVGSHSITAVYGGDSNFNGSLSPTLTQNVNQGPSTTTVASLPNPSSYGNSTIFTATVTGSGGIPGGTVTFKDGATTLGTGTLTLGIATYSTSALTGGNHSITAVYGGDTSYSGSTSSVLTHTVNARASASVVSSSQNPSLYGVSVTFTATIASLGGTPTGTVTFKNGSTTLGTGTLNGAGQATFSTNALAVGNHSITSEYAGDGNIAGSTSLSLLQIVNANTSSTSLSSGTNPGTFGQSVTFTASVSGSAGTPSGTVTFYDGLATLGTGTLNGSGQATYSTSALSTGLHTVTASYGGNSAYGTSISNSVIQTIDRANSSVAIALSQSTVAYGAPVTILATVNGTGAVPSGLVTFRSGATVIGIDTLDGTGHASLSTSSLPVGSQTITVSYAGDLNFLPSVSSGATLTVSQSSCSVVLLTSGSTIQLGDTLILNATVTGPAGIPTGTVTFKAGSSTLATVALNILGQATTSTSLLGLGMTSLTAVYNGDSTYTSCTSPAVNVTVNPGNSSTTVTSSGNPAAFGTNVTFTATVTGAMVIPTGTVTFKDGATTLGTGTLDSSGEATFVTNALAMGLHTITAVYAGDANLTGSTSLPLVQVINANSSSTSVVSSANPSALGASVTFTATVTGTGGTPTGTVTFRDGLTTLGTGTLNGSGVATYTTSALTGGSHSITASYGGDTNYSASTSLVITQLVNQGTSSVVVTSSVNPVALGASVTFTATVTGSGPTPTGLITFRDNGFPLGIGTLNASGQATLTIFFIVAGNHPITAAYGGNSNYTAQTSAVLNQGVSLSTTSVALTSSANPSALGASVTFTATVSGTGGTPTGTVNFLDGVVSIGTGTLNGSGEATLSTAALTAGSHSITAVYAGDSNFLGNVSPVLNQTVNVNSSTTSLGSSANPSTFGQSITLTATVVGSGGTPTGNVAFKDGATTIGTSAVNGSGVATFSTSALTGGSHSLTAVYAGDSLTASSTSSVLTQVVNATTSSVSLSSSANPSALAASVTFTATVTGTGGTPTGNVTFKDGATTIGTGTLNGSGQATYATSALTSGSHSITAVYAGDTNFGTSTSSVLTQAVNSGNSTVTLNATPNPAAAGTPVTLTATVTGNSFMPTGNVAFKDGATTIGWGTLDAAGHASFTTSAFLAGSHSLTAVYSGDSNFSPSTSAVRTLTVTSTASAMTLVVTPAPLIAGNSATLTATVITTGSTATGTVTFYDGATVIGSNTLNASAQAQLTIGSVRGGLRLFRAYYSGNGQFDPSWSATVAISVATTQATATLTSSVNPSTLRQPVTFKATVSGSAGAPTGVVTFKDGSLVIGTSTLSGGIATLTTSALAAGSHAITAAYGGDANYAPVTSAALMQSVTVPRDSLNLRAMQVAATKVVSRVSGAAIDGAIDTAISDAFSNGGQMVIPSDFSIRFNSGGTNREDQTASIEERDRNERHRLALRDYAYGGPLKDQDRVKQTFDAADQERPKWLMWTDIRGYGWNTVPSKGDLVGGQVNAMMGLTYKFSPDYVAGLFGGYEHFDYKSDSLNGTMTGGGATVGAYMGWRFLPGLRLDLGVAHSMINYDTESGTASGSFTGHRTLVKAGLTGTYTFDKRFEFEPSLRAYGLIEQQQSYEDSLGTPHDKNTIATARVSLGAKATYRWEVSNTAQLAPYIGIYADYQFSRDGGETQVATSEAGPTSLFDGASVRIISGVSLITIKGASLSVGGEVSGLGSGAFTAASARARAAIPF